MSDHLAAIIAYKRDEVAALKREGRDWGAQARAQSPPRGFAAALSRKADSEGVALIAEIKKASPSRGLIRADFDPPALARAYEAGGAACLSVLTDRHSFQGADDVLMAARAACSLPCLRKDFMIDPVQIAQSRALGADAVLIIMAAVNGACAAELAGAARDYGMDVLIECHDQTELARALTLPDGMIGVNNRDLRTFETRLETTERLAPLVPETRLVVSESGIAAPGDVARVRAAGARAVLVGESLMRQEDVRAATRALMARPGMA